MTSGKSIAELFKRVRAKSGLSQEKMALKLMIERTYLSGIENGKKLPSERLINAINLVAKSLPDVYKVDEDGERYEASSEPDRGDCETYFDAFLDKAENVGGAIGWTYIELQESFPLDKFAPKPDFKYPTLEEREE